LSGAHALGRAQITFLEETDITQDGVIPIVAASTGKTSMHIALLVTDLLSFRPWVVNPTRFSNQYYKLLLTRKWEPRKWDGPFQYVTALRASSKLIARRYEATVAGTKLMMLPTDVSVMDFILKNAYPVSDGAH